MASRRTILKGLAGTALGLLGTGGYAFGIEPGIRLRVQRYAFTPPRWTPGLKLRIVALADIHASYPYMSPARIGHIVAAANGLAPDLTVLLGDYTAGMRRFGLPNVEAAEWSAQLGRLRAPLGVFSVLGNHDWWDDHTAQAKGAGPTFSHRALAEVGIPVLENDARRLAKDGKPFWLAGLGDQIALIRGRRRLADGTPPQPTLRRLRFQGVDDLPGTLAKLTDEAPAILLAHEPDIFTEVPARVSLTLSGHTHGGQVRLFGWSPVVPSAYGARFAYGHIVEAGRHLVVSGGLGTSIIPVRLGVPPEIVLLELG